MARRGLLDFSGSRGGPRAGARRRDRASRREPGLRGAKGRPHRDAMRTRIAEIAGVTIYRVGVKATTAEKLGFVGRREGVACMALATVRLPEG